MNLKTKLNELDFKISHEKNSEYLESIKLAEELFLDVVNTKSMTYLHILILKSLIIKCNPKRIIKKGTKSQSGTQFETSIMCLLKSNDIKFSDVKIEPNLLISSPDGFLEHKLIVSPNNPNLWILKNMRWHSTTAGRSSRRSTCDKYIIEFKFSGKYLYQNQLKEIEKSLYSDTIVIVVHSNQEVDSYMTLFWDDYYRECRNPEQLDFSCKSQSNLKELIDNLSLFFSKETNKPLTENNKHYLLQKIRDLNPSSEVITNEEFMKRPMQSTKMSFGQWIMSIIKMLKIPTLEKLWVENRIEGFVEKNVQTILNSRGSFLLRFSERQSAIGVIVKNECDEIKAWEPYTDANLRQSNLANLLSEFSHLKTMILSNRQILDRDEALQPFMDPVEIDDGYTRRGGNGHEQDSEMSFQESPLVHSNGFSPVFSSDMDTDSNVDIDECQVICESLLQNDQKLN